MTEIKDGDLIFIVYDKRRQWVRKVKINQQFHCDRGYLNFNDIIGSKFGETFFLQPNKNKVALIKPLPCDIISHMKRQSQIIYPEDIGLILTYSGIKSGSKVLEAGTGSATVSSLLGMFCTESGKVNTFDIRDIAIEQAKKNIIDMGVEKIVEAKYGNILEDKFNFESINFIMLDLATTWLAVPLVLQYLADDAKMCLFSPTIEQVKKNHSALKNNGIPNITTIELLKRTFQVKPNATRPHGRMVAHTGYLTFACKQKISVISELYTDYYTPENIGSLYLYGGILPGKQILVIANQKSKILEILKLQICDELNFIICPDNCNENELDDIIKKYKNDKDGILFDSILIDNISKKNLINSIHTKLKIGGSICSLSSDVETMKIHYNELKNLNYYEIIAFEHIKLQIIIDRDQNSSHSAFLPSNGYVTVGRNIKDNFPLEEKIPPKDEFVEPMIDVGLNYKNSLPKEKKKIDYANLTE